MLLNKGEPGEGRDLTLWKKIGLLVLIFLGVIGIYGLLVGQSSKIYPGVRLDTIGLGGLTKEEAYKKLEENLEDRLKKDLVLVYQDKEFTTNLRDLGYSYDLEGMVEDAYGIGHKASFGENFISALQVYFQGPLALEGSFKKGPMEDYLQGLGDRIDRTPQNAEIILEGDQVQVKKDRAGRFLDQKKTAKRIQAWSGEGEVALPVYVKKAQVQTQDLESIDGVLGDFETKYGTSEKNRKFNIALGAEKLNNFLIQPGQEVSFNDRMDQITKEAGFKTSGVIKNGVFDRGVGGGICQVSTTLYNALVRADVEIIERHNHSRPIGYVKNGTDAAVATGHKNLVFKNPYKTPIYIKSSADGQTLGFQVFGSQAEKDYEVKMIPKLLGSQKPRTEKIYTDRLSQGDSQVVESGHRGYYYKTYIEKIRDGEVFERKEISTSSYPAGRRVVYVGTRTSNSSNDKEDKE